MKTETLKPRATTTAAERAEIDDFLQPIIDATAEYFGSRIKLAELLSKRIGARISRSTVQRWLSDSPSQRMEPKLGLGLLLRKVFQEHKREILRPWDAKKRRRPRSKKTKDEKHHGNKKEEKRAG